MALVMVQQPESKLASLRKRIDKIVKDKHEEVCVLQGGSEGCRPPHRLLQIICTLYTLCSLPANSASQH